MHEDDSKLAPVMLGIGVLAIKVADEGRMKDDEVKKLIDTLKTVAKAPPISDDRKREIARASEEEGYKLLYKDNNPETAFKAYDDAAHLYRELKDHQKASSCFAAAGSCWLIRCGQELLWNAASRYEYAGDEAAKIHHHVYAKSLYEKSAALARTENALPAFSRAYYKSKLSQMKHSFLIFANSQKLKDIPGVSYDTRPRTRGKHFGVCLLHSLLFLIWGYGEKPYRALLSILVVILSCAMAYYFSGGLLSNGKAYTPSVADAVYLSVVTFTTLGYGDIIPFGCIRIVAMAEALSSLFLIPLFLVALVRKYIGTFS